MNIIQQAIQKLVPNVEQQRLEIVNRLLTNNMITPKEALILSQSTININIEKLDFEMSSGAKILINSEYTENDHF